MPKHKPRQKPAEPSGLLLSGLRTLDAEAGGITALTAAMQDGLGPAFTAGERVRVAEAERAPLASVR